MRRMHVQHTLMLLIALLLFTSLGLAHETYVLPQDVVEDSVSTDSPNPFTAAQENKLLSAAMGIGILLMVITAFLVSIREEFGERFHRPLQQIKRYAPIILQITLGLGLIASAVTRQFFGPELPLSAVLADTQLLAAILYAAGLLILFNIETRVSALSALAMFLLAFDTIGAYLLTYAGYLGLILFVLVRDSKPALDEMLEIYLPPLAYPAKLVNNTDKKYLLLRILYGSSIIYAALYAKFWNSNLALATIEHHQLTQYLPIDPLFIVMAALTMELLVGVFFLIGFEIRLMTLLLIGVNSTSFLVFREALWPHIALVGVAVGLFFHGYDAYTFENLLTRKRKYEPLL